jgi:hypothetical protein
VSGRDVPTPLGEIWKVRGLAFALPLTEQSKRLLIGVRAQANRDAAEEAAPGKRYVAAEIR